MKEEEEPSFVALFNKRIQSIPKEVCKGKQQIIKHLTSSVGTLIRSAMLGNAN